MSAFEQIAKYLLVTVLMIPMLGLALIIAVISVNTGWRIYRQWSRMALMVFGIRIVSEYEFEPSELENGGVVVSTNQQSLLDPTIAYAEWDKRVLSIWNIEYAMIPFFG